MYNVLITPMDNHNESTIILIKKYKFKNILVLQEEECKREIKENLIKVSREEGGKVEFFNDSEIKERLKKFPKEEVLINLTGGERIQSLYFLDCILKNNLRGIYVDIVKRKKYIFGKGEDVKEEHLLDLEINDLINASGNEIIEDGGEDLGKKKYILEISKIIHENMDIWNKHKRKLYDLNVFSHYYGDTKKVIVKREKLEKEEKILLDKIIRWGKGENLIDTEKEGEDLIVKFKDKYLKSFLFKSGTWLEVLTESIVSEIKEIDEVKSGLVFKWRVDGALVKNELDVVAIRDSTMVVISCKDSEKYNEVALNELVIYSERIGGKKVKKILVATKMPNKEGVMERAKEMGIEIVVLGKDLKEFKRDLIKAIN